MVPSQEKAARVGFGLYEADLLTGELWKAGRKIRLQSQPFRVLAALLERPGEVVSRAELQTLLWGKDAVGDFDQSLGTAVNKIREALGDHADNPRFVETLARRGYRFIAPVQHLPSVGPATPSQAEPLLPLPVRHVVVPAVEPDIEVPVPAALPVQEPVSSVKPVPEISAFPTKPVAAQTERKAVSWGPVGLSLALLGTFLLGALLMWLQLELRGGAAPAPLLRMEQLTHIGKIAPGMPGMESLPASASNGQEIFVPVLVDGRSVLSRVDTHTGSVHAMNLPHEVASPMLGDLSPDQSTLLLRNHLSPESEQPLWLAPVSGDSALRLPNVVAHDATWMPDGKAILYATGNRLTVTRPGDGSSTLFATLPGRALWLRWSPDGSLLRFTLLDPVRHTMGLWQVNRDGKELRPVLQGWNEPTAECCGVWADNGRYFVFQSNRGDHTDLWRLHGKSLSSPVRVTDGPLNFAAPVAAGQGSRVYFLGLQTQSLLQRFDASQGQFVPASGPYGDASRVEYSRDGRSVVWVDMAGRTWRAQADGTERLQLTPDAVQTFTAHWSPDGQQIALMAREQGKAWQLYVMPAEGGTLHHLDTGPGNAADPSWSADGREIVFGRLNDVMGDEEGPRFLARLTLQMGSIVPVPGSEGLFSPRWSPDGRYIAALSLDQHQLLLFDVAAGSWRTLAQTTAADPVWAGDSKAIFFHAALAEHEPIYRVTLPDGRLHPVISLSSFPNTPTDYFFSGLTATGEPLVRTRTATGDLYSVDLEEK